MRSLLLCLTRVRRLLRCQTRSVIDITIVTTVIVIVCYVLHRLNTVHQPHFKFSSNPIATVAAAAAAAHPVMDVNDALGEISLDYDQSKVTATISGQEAADLNRPVAASFNITVSDSRLHRIGDFRLQQCSLLTYKIRSTVSVIIDFNDYQFFDARNTMDSCLLLNTNIQLIKEIIAVDDGSTLDYVIEESNKYFGQIPKAKLIRTGSERLGSAQSRLIGLSQVTADNVIFLDSTVLCSVGWLEPLLDALSIYPDSLVMPHYDSVKDPVSLEYQPSNLSLIPTLSWDLTVRPRYSHNPLSLPDPIKSPVVHSSLFAVTKSFFADVGSYDSQLSVDVTGLTATHVELSLRAWMCAGNILTIPCSRVGLLRLYEPLRVTDVKAVYRITSMWLSSYAIFVIRSVTADIKLVKQTTNQRPSLQRCDVTSGGHDASWYFANIASDLVVPSTNAVKFGLLRVRTGRCARLLTTTSRLALQDCNQLSQFTRPSNDMVFELSRQGQLKVNGKCVSVQQNAYLLAVECVDSDTHQLWHYTGQLGELINVWCQYCATHVTDPDVNAPADRQIAMAQECNHPVSDNTPDNINFRSWQFLTF